MILFTVGYTHGSLDLMTDLEKTAALMLCNGTDFLTRAVCGSSLVSLAVMYGKSIISRVLYVSASCPIEFFFFFYGLCL